MNKNTEKKVYVAPQMSILKMENNCPLLSASFYESKKAASPRSTIVNDNYNIVDFD